MLLWLKQFLSPPRDQSATLGALRLREEGAVAIEYSLIAALIVVVVIVALVQLRAGLINLPLPTLNAAFEGALS